jgi:hypothetical protein
VCEVWTENEIQAVSFDKRADWESNAHGKALMLFPFGGRFLED